MIPLSTAPSIGTPFSSTPCEVKVSTSALGVCTAPPIVPISPDLNSPVVAIAVSGSAHDKKSLSGLAGSPPTGVVKASSVSCSCWTTSSSFLAACAASTASLWAFSSWLYA